MATRASRGDSAVEDSSLNQTTENQSQGPATDTQPCSTAPMSIARPHPEPNYTKDNTFLSFLAVLPKSQQPKSHIWGNEATAFFILALAEAREEGMMTSEKWHVDNTQGRSLVWDYVRRRFSENGLHALVQNLTDEILEMKLITEERRVYTPYKRLRALTSSGESYEMDEFGQFHASDDWWQRVDPSGRWSPWLKETGMPLWQQYESIYEEPIDSDWAVNHKRKILAMVKEQTRILNETRGTPAASSIATANQTQTPTQTPTPEPASSAQLPDQSTSEPPQKRPRKSMDTVDRFTQGFKEVSEASMRQTVETMMMLLDRQTTPQQTTPQQTSALRVIVRLKLGKEVESAASKAVHDGLKLAQILEFESNNDLEGLRQWCLELVDSK